MDVPIHIVIAICISLIGVAFAINRGLLKSGVRIRGLYSTNSSISCEDNYVGKVFLENQKDRAVTIFGIYLKVGHNYYIHLENFKDSPLILKAFEHYQKIYDPIEFYSVNLKRIRLNQLLGNRKVKKRLVLSTSEGKYVVPVRFARWDPVYDFFRNHYTAVVEPIRLTYKGVSYGENAIYLIEFKFEDGTDKVMPIHPNDFEIKVFKHFSLSKSDLESKQTLQHLLDTQKANGNLTATSIVVHDLREMKSGTFDVHEKPEIQGVILSRFRYHVLGRIYTKLSDRRLRKKNRENAMRANKALQPTPSRDTPTSSDRADSPSPSNQSSDA